MKHGVPWLRFGRDLWRDVGDDNVSNGAAALAYFLMVSIFPGIIALLAVLPFLPIPHLDKVLMDFIMQLMPRPVADLLRGTVTAVVAQRQSGLLSLGIALAIWSASTGLYAVMQQLNVTYGVKEARSFLKARGTALLLTGLFGVLIIGASALVVFGGVVEGWLSGLLGDSSVLLGAFTLLRWGIAEGCLLLGFSLTYYLGPAVELRFHLINPGSVLGVVALGLASEVFKFYVTHLANYSAVYGGLGTVIIMLLWLYVCGWVILLGAEVNALAERYARTERPGKNAAKAASAEIPGAGLPPPLMPSH